jgi:D-glycero-D-manno-heptose 1,7-bisphosphate phosphatase
VFLDRDGILNDLVMRDGAAVSPRRVQDFRIRAGAPNAVQSLRAVGARILVATNQPDVARGFLPWGELARMTEILTRALAVDDVGICPHDDLDGCDCRKPKPGLLLAMAERWCVHLGQSVVIGDSWKDVEAGRRAGCRTILVTSEVTSVGADHVVRNLADAVEKATSILREGDDQ